MNTKHVTSINSGDLDGMKARIVAYPISFERLLEYENGSRLLVHRDNVVEYKEQKDNQN